MDKVWKVYAVQKRNVGPTEIKREIAANSLHPDAFNTEVTAVILRSIQQS